MAAQGFRVLASVFGFVALAAAAAPPKAAVVAFRVEKGAPHVRIREGVSAAIETSADAHLVTIHVAGAKASRRIDRLPIDTAGFGTVVERIEVVRESAGLTLRVHLKGASLPPIVALPYSSNGVSGMDVRFGAETSDE